MPELTTDKVKEYLKPLEGREVTLNAIRADLEIDKGSKAWQGIRNILFQISEQGIVRASGKRDGVWKVVKHVSTVPVFSIPRERRPPVDLKFPRDRDTDLELPMAGKVIIREGDLILIGGVSNFGKTTMSLNFLAENIEFEPVLMGNEFTSLVEKEYRPTPRFLSRLDAMNWVSWVYEDGGDRFTLLPVFEDFAENVVKDKINIIDWINIESGEHYLIGNILNGIKRANGKGITIAVLQKAQGMESARGGQFTKDFADLELLIDRHSNLESRITVGKCKESTEGLTGRSWSFQIRNQGTSICDVKEVKKCWKCLGSGHGKGGECEQCKGVGWVGVKTAIPF